MTIVDRDLQERMFHYYDERAAEYDEIYTGGRGSTAISDPSAYIHETAVLSTIVGQVCRGRLVDIPCGTGFWLARYGPNCPAIALLDQSPRMLAESRHRVQSVGLVDRCTLVRANAFAPPFRRDAFDTALVGFFLSHLDAAQERQFFDLLRTILDPDGVILILDSAWSVERARTRPKCGRQTRTLNDGRTFDIYKRYFDRHDVATLAAVHDLDLSIAHLGRAFIAITGTLNRRG